MSPRSHLRAWQAPCLLDLPSTCSEPLSTPGPGPPPSAGCPAEGWPGPSEARAACCLQRPTPAQNLEANTQLLVINLLCAPLRVLPVQGQWPPP